MNIIISGKGFQVSSALRDSIMEKLNKLNRYFNEDTTIHVTLSVEKDRQKVEVTIPVKGKIIRAEQESDDMYVSIDLVEDIIERQLRKYKTKIIDNKQSATNFSKQFVEETPDDDEEIVIRRTKKFAVKPMSAEEAAVQMELLGHNFYVFRNETTNEVNVIYKRKGATYGLIEPD